MKPKVYVESSVISYLTARPSNDLVSAARQTITEAWWAENLEHFAVFVSELVEQEIAQGHPDAAARRLAQPGKSGTKKIDEISPIDFLRLFRRFV